MPVVGKNIEIIIDDFGTMVRENYLLIDKTLMIRSFIEGQKVSLITRPRRFGKTLNMSMLHYFFAPEIGGKPTKDLFHRFAIAKEVDEHGDSYIDKYQGQYPVIFISFKDVKERASGNKTFPESKAVNKIRVLIRELYRQHKHLLVSNVIDEYDKAEFKNYCYGQANQEELGHSLKFLSEFLHKVYRKKVIILIDEYDTPLTSAYEHGYIDELSDFMRNLFSATLKNNIYLEKALMTGILHVSQNSMLSGLNNVEIYTLLDEDYQQYFGFTEEEVVELIVTQEVNQSLTEIKHYYNGYQIGCELIYNPWSLMNYFKKGKLSPYWVLTSNDKLLKNILLDSSDVIKEHLAQLMGGCTIEAPINTNLRYEELMDNPNTLWTLLVFCGYLTSTNLRSERNSSLCKLKIPNEEIQVQYQTVFANWMQEKIGFSEYNMFLNNLVDNRVALFIQNLRYYLLECARTKDFKSESNYHTFLLGLLSGLTETHYLISNKEAGLGFPDLLLIPKDSRKTQGLIIEFKYIDYFKKNKTQHLDIESLFKDGYKTVVEALNQINSRAYDVKFLSCPYIKQILKIGIFLPIVISLLVVLSQRLKK